MSMILLPYTHSCFVCGVDNPAGLQLKFHAKDGMVQADFRPRPQHQGYRDIVHGGVIASALDEVMFWVASYEGRQFYVSAELSVRYMKKVQVGCDYRLVSRVAGRQRRIFLTEAELRAVADDSVCATASGRFFPVPLDQVPLDHEDFVTDPKALPLEDMLPGWKADV